MKRLYKARWGLAGKPSIGNVSFEAASDYHAKKRADRIARELGLCNTPRTLSRGAQTIEVLPTGRTKP